MSYCVSVFERWDSGVVVGRRSYERKRDVHVHDNLGAGPDFVVGVSCDMRYMGRIENALSFEFGSLAFSEKDD